MKRPPDEIAAQAIASDQPYPTMFGALAGAVEVGDLERAQALVEAWDKANGWAL